MKNKLGTGLKLRGCHLAIAAALAVSSPAHAIQFDWGDWSGSWDNTISYGISWRVEDPDPALIGIGNGGTGPANSTDNSSPVGVLTKKCGFYQRRMGNRVCYFSSIRIRSCPMHINLNQFRNPLSIPYYLFG